MSTFDVSIRKITQLDDHPNADRLELVVIGGYKAVVQKGIHSVGDLILYIPTDAVFTDMTVAEQMQIAMYLTGKEKNRVKGIRLRGVFSEGIVIPLAVIDETLAALGFGYYSFREGIDFKEELKIEKYEPPIPIELAGQVRRWPDFLPHYDLENIKRPEFFNAFVEGEHVIVTEKLHGSNMAIAFGPGLEEGERAFVCSRNMALKESDSNAYWRAVKKYDLIHKLECLKDDYFACTGEVAENVSIHGELLGVQDLKYGFNGGDVGFRVFDIRINGEYCDYCQVESVCEMLGLDMVPVIYQGPFDYQKICELIEVKSRLADHIMEGGVCQTYTEDKTVLGNRRKLKFISEQYLTRKGGTENH